MNINKNSGGENRIYLTQQIFIYQYTIIPWQFASEY